MIRTVWLAALAAAMLPGSAQAAGIPISSDPAASWKHALTGIDFPAELAGLKRQRLTDLTRQQLDVFANYFSADGKTEATIYVFRAGLADTSIWHDRILVQIGSGRLDEADFANALQGTFAAPTGNGGGLRTVTAMSGKHITASGVSIFEHDGWLIAVRYSSQTLSAAELDTQLAAFTAAIPVPAPTKSVQTAYVIQPCADKLPSKQAKRAKADMANALMQGLLGQMVESGEAKPVDDPASVSQRIYCRDSTTTDSYGVYRWGPAKDGFVLAFGDAGIGAFVTPDATAELLDKGKGQYALSLITVDRSLNYVGFLSLPTPEQAVAVVGKEAPMSSATRPIGASGDRTISINPGN